MHGEFKFAVQIDHKGYFAMVYLMVEKTETDSSMNVVIPKMNVEFGDYDDHDWDTGVRFGLDYIWRYLPTTKFDIKGLNVKILEVDSNPVDTTVPIVALATVKALIQALDIPYKKLPYFNETTAEVVFPLGIAEIFGV